MNRKGFTLVELLLVVAIIATIGGGVAVTYGKSTLDRARRQMTLHEMGEIRTAFEHFHADNATRIFEGVDLPGTTTELPTTAFCSGFSGADAPVAATPTAHDRIYGMLEFYERFGLWALLQPSISWQGHRAETDFVVFSASNVALGEGWQGPYAQTATRVNCIVNSTDNVLEVATDANSSSTDPFFPQLGSRYDNGFYRVVYFEHCEDEADASEPIYRRLILMAAEDPSEWDEWDEIKLLTGNRRGGATSSASPDYAYPLDRATGAIRLYDEKRGLFFVELLNLDRNAR